MNIFHPLWFHLFHLNIAEEFRQLLIGFTLGICLGNLYFSFTSIYTFITPQLIVTIHLFFFSLTSFVILSFINFCFTEKIISRRIILVTTWFGLHYRPLNTSGQFFFQSTRKNYIHLQTITNHSESHREHQVCRNFTFELYTLQCSTIGTYRFHCIDVVASLIAVIGLNVAMVALPFFYSVVIPARKARISITPNVQDANRASFCLLFL